MFNTHANRACLLLFYLCSAANARSAVSIVHTIAQGLPSADSAWQLREKHSERYGDGSVHADIEWTNGATKLGATVIVHRTLTSARHAFRPDGKDDPHESFRVSGIGDEAFLWPPIVLTGGAYNLRFREGRTEVWISAASQAEIERIAGIIAGAVSSGSD